MKRFYTCKKCGKRKNNNKKKFPPELCKECYLENHRRKQPLSCNVCGKELNPDSSLKTKKCRKCFLKSHTTIFKEVDYDNDFGNWLMGFVDGEGNFHCYKNGAGGMAFRIILREDDKEILEEIRQKLGAGKLFYRDVIKNMPNWQEKYQSKVRRNQYAYTINSVYDLVNVIVPYFEHFHLRAKKKLQYEIWRDLLMERYGFLKEMV